MLTIERQRFKAVGYVDRKERKKERKGERGIKNMGKKDKEKKIEVAKS